MNEKTKISAEITQAATRCERKHRHTVSLSLEDCKRQLEALYSAEVVKRGGEYKQTDTKTIAKAAEWLTRRHRFGLLLCGGVGTGKTTLARAMCELINHMPYRLCRYEEGGIMFAGTCSSGDWQAEPLGVIDECSAVELAHMAIKDSDRFETLKRTARLFIDDLGCEPQAVKSFGTELSPIAELIEWRNDRQLFTIATTNLSPRTDSGSSELLEFYGTRTESRMAELFDIIAIKGGDHRKEAK